MRRGRAVAWSPVPTEALLFSQQRLQNGEHFKETETIFLRKMVLDSKTLRKKRRAVSFSLH